MEAYRHFSLLLAPFETEPDPQFFVETPTHHEALATLRYAYRTGKPCCLVLGESGSGKTLLGRLFAEDANARSWVLWLHGIGQPTDRTEVTLYPPMGDGRSAIAVTDGPVETTVSDWLRSPGANRRTLLVVDNADALRGRHWDDLLAVLTREACANGIVSVVLLGLPNLVERISAARLVRLRRRIFRICQLERLSRDELEQYVQQRLAVAGCAAMPFTTCALDMIHQLTGGNPALVNQLCDNALIDAFGDDRQQIAERDVAATVRTITSSPQVRHRVGVSGLRQLTAGNTVRPSQLAQVAERVRKLVNDEIVAADGETVVECGADNTDEAEAATPTAEDTSPEQAEDAESTSAEISAEEAGDPAPSTSQPETDDPAAVPASAVTPAAEAVARATRAADAVAPGEDDERPDETAGARAMLADRLRMVEGRINDALARVREARTKRAAEAPASTGVGRTGNSSDPDVNPEEP